jgi:hypothetical protein
MNSLFKIISKQSKLVSFNKSLFSDKKVEPVKNDIKTPEFVNFHNKTPKHHEELQKMADSEIMFNYGSHKQSVTSQVYNKFEFQAKALRHGWFRLGTLYHSHKHVIPVKRLRTKEDTLFKLLKQGEIACCLQGREEFDEIHFVLDKKWTKHLDGYIHLT